MRRALLFVTMLLGALLVPVTATTAQADPYSCSADHYTHKSWAYCGSGTGTYRAVATCYNGTWAFNWTQYGPTVRVGAQSVADCGPDWAMASSLQIMSLR